jgi:cytochrome P450
MNHSSENWADPWEFKPERFVEGIPGNKLEALQAFSVGPRNCIGRKYVLRHYSPNIPLALFLGVDVGTNEI